MKFRRVAIIGGGWYGCHIAAEIRRISPNTSVSLYEKNSEIFSEVSGNFGIRLHAGPHYPRSPKTRQACHSGFEEFLNTYPELVNDHSFSDYALGVIDSNGQPSKVTTEHFKAVCQEFGNAVEINPKDHSYINVTYVGNLREPSVALGSKLRQFFTYLLKKRKVDINCGVRVVGTNLLPQTNQLQIEFITTLHPGREHGFEVFDDVINASCYQSLLPSPDRLKNLIAENISYHVHVAIVYELNVAPPTKPFSFIVMDGAYPCVMPVDDELGSSGEAVSKYILTHGAHTNLGNFETIYKARRHLSQITNARMEVIRKASEFEMSRFWPEFRNLFTYKECKAGIIPKIDCDNAYRNAIAFQDNSSRIIYVFPGKINNVFDVGREVLALLGLQSTPFVQISEFTFVKNGILHQSLDEIGF